MRRRLYLKAQENILIKFLYLRENILNLDINKLLNIKSNSQIKNLAGKNVNAQDNFCMKI